MKGKKEKDTQNEEESVIDYEGVDDDGGLLEKDPTEAIKKLKKELRKCKKESQENLFGWQRAQADLINERKEMEKSASRVAEAAQEALIMDILPVLDSFDMAFANKEVWEQVDQNWRIGVEHIHSSLLSVFSQYGISSYEPVGEAFDPKEHEPLESVPTSEKKEDNKISEVLQKGYRKGDVIIRSAKVKVFSFQDLEK